jgi:ATP-dependent DNA helicase 2 subunit 2
VLSALVVAIQMISKATTGKLGPLKYTRRIVVVTHGYGSIDEEDLDHITSKIKEDGIELTLLGVDFDDPEFGFKEERKNKEKVSHSLGGRHDKC